MSVLNEDTTNTSDVNGGVLVKNNVENSNFITMTLKTGAIIGPNIFLAICFTMNSKLGVPDQTS